MGQQLEPLGLQIPAAHGFEQIGHPLCGEGQGETVPRCAAAWPPPDTGSLTLPAPCGPGRRPCRCPGRNRAGWTPPDQSCPVGKGFGTSFRSRSAPPGRCAEGYPGPARRQPGPDPNRTAPIGVPGQPAAGAARRCLSPGRTPASPCAPWQTAPGPGRRFPEGTHWGAAPADRDPAALYYSWPASPPLSLMRDTRCRVIRPVSPQIALPSQG